MKCWCIVEGLTSVRFCALYIKSPFLKIHYGGGKRSCENNQENQQVLERLKPSPGSPLPPRPAYCNGGESPSQLVLGWKVALTLDLRQRDPEGPRVSGRQLNAVQGTRLFTDPAGGSPILKTTILCDLPGCGLH